jgi:cell division septation protein DedD
MTKAEIIRKLAKKVGVSDTDAKIFFEVFLRKVSQQLNPGDLIKIKNFGAFQLRTGKIKNASPKDADLMAAELIIFFPLKHEPDESNEVVIFNIPIKQTEDFNLIDSYFSLSFGKPVIPLKDANVSEYFIPPTGNELRRLIDTKADKLLQEVEVVENGLKGNEILLIDPESLNLDQLEINWDEIVSEPEKELTKEPEIYTWDFSGALEKQIEEEALLDTGNDDNQPAGNPDIEALTWDFGESAKDKEEPEEYQRVNSVTSSFNIEHESEQIPETEVEQNNVSIEPVLQEDPDLLDIINEEMKEESFASEVETKDIAESTIEIPTLDSPYQLEKEIEETFNDIPQITEPSLPYSKKKGTGLYVTIVLLFLLCGSLFIYLKFARYHIPFIKQTSSIKVEERKPTATIIQRDFDIPVTYPYAKESDTNSAFESIDKNALDDKNITKKEPEKQSVNSNIDQVKQPVDTKTEQIKQPVETKIEQVKPSLTKVKELIYKSGDKFVVQVSSWSSEKNALKHASFYNGKGYKTEIVKANLNKGAWYRVMVGYFNTEEEAEKFHNP